MWGAGDVIAYNSVSNILKTEAAQTNLLPAQTSTNKAQTIETFGDVLRWVGGGGATSWDCRNACFLIPFFLLYPLSDFIIILKHDRPVIWSLLETEKIHICYITTGGKLYLKLKIIMYISR